MPSSYGRNDLSEFSILETTDDAVVLAEGELPLETTVSGCDVVLDYEGQIPKSKLRLSVEDCGSLSGILPGHLPLTMGSIEICHTSTPSRPSPSGTAGP